MTNPSEPLAPPAHVASPARRPPAAGAAKRRDLLVRGIAAAGVAALVNLGILGAATAARASMIVAQGGSEIVVGLVPVLVATFAPLTLATLVAWLLAKRWPRTTRILAWVGLAAAAASTIVPLTGSLDAATGIALALMHLVAGASWFAAMVSYRRG